MPEADLRERHHRRLGVWRQSFTIEPSHTRIPGSRQIGQTRTDRYFPPVFYRFHSLNLKETAPHRDRDSVGPVVGMQLLDDILDVEINGRLCDTQLASNLFVAVAFLNQPKHLEFPGREIFFTNMFCEAGRRFARHLFSAGVDRADRIDQLAFRRALKEVTRGPCPQGTLDFGVAVGRREHDDLRCGKLSTDCNESVRAIRSRKPEIHQRYIRFVAAKLFESLDRVRCLRYQEHIRLRTNDHAQAFPEYWMVFYAKDANRLGNQRTNILSLPEMIRAVRSAE